MVKCRAVLVVYVAVNEPAALAFAADMSPSLTKRAPASGSDARRAPSSKIADSFTLAVGPDTHSTFTAFAAFNAAGIVSAATTTQA